MPRRANFVVCSLVCLLGPLAGIRAEETPSPAAIEFFEKKVRPILAEHCFECHGDKKQRGGLRVDSRDVLLKGTDNGPALIPGKPNESRLIQALRHEGDIAMPPKGKLPQTSIDVMTEWVAQGAIWPANIVPKPGVLAGTDVWKSHWSFQPIRRSPLPVVVRSSWVQNEIDQFVLAKLESQKLTPSPAADRRTFLRRAYFDVVGLPPAFEDVKAFEEDVRPNAVELAVERLLASPQYGERWGRHWLDVARYADTKGYVFQEDRNYPQAYTYRDWVVKALNRDLPYDQFLLKQIAADQLTSGDDQSDLAAMGFLTLGRRFLNNINDIIDDRIDVVMRGTMGLTVNCARCHDHKYDPIPTQDYYSLYGVFASSKEPKDGAFPLRLVDDNPHNVQVFIRGNSGNRGPEAPRRFLLAIAGENRKPFEKGSGRLEMAQAIVSPDNPLTARVFVNRVWMHYFGAGLVLTPSDFGIRSAPPTHPELLDDLALEFIDSGWSMKSVHRKILLSATYQQSSQDRKDCQAVDPENRLVWKMNRRRLEFEGLRDNLLAVSATLDLTVGGPSVQITTAPFPKRRSVYSFIDRQNLPGLFRTFDLASPDAHNAQRFTTTVPQQALFMLNSPFMLETLKILVNRPEFQREQDPANRIRLLHQWIFSRNPADRELKLGQDYVQSAQASSGTETAAVSGWQNGYGELDSAAGRMKSFELLKHWTGRNWQGGEKVPDDQLGWVMLYAGGGHPGNDLQHSAIRRWIAPRTGALQIRGRLRHRSTEGDGVQCRVISSRSGVAGDWTAQHSETETVVDNLAVEAGDSIDFCTDCRTSPNNDSFLWDFKLKLSAGTAGERTDWDSQADFQGPPPELLSPWERYAQVLLMANEFVFVD
ncbi:MAG: Protein of unknown function (DUF1553)/Protein of unknown function (DUF1549)/Planctomycete [Planctomycetaceae bacterium]|nr:Protein of unknown function (DUF1553)/Protein of unknown function (DUF1549)/Planctomycete [Planctomycetaceae bacterium]